MVEPRSTGVARRRNWKLIGHVASRTVDRRNVVVERDRKYLRKAGVQLSPQLLYRDDRVLILGMRALQAVVHAVAQTMAQGDVAPANRTNTIRVSEVTPMR